MSAGTGPADGRSSAVRVVFVLAAGAVAIVGLHLGREVLAPALLALVLVITVHPVRRRLLRWGLPNAVATAAVIVVAWAVLLSILALVVIAIGQFDRLIVGYGDDLVATISRATAPLGDLGYSVEPRTVDTDVLREVVAGVTGALGAFVVALAFVLTYIVFMAADARSFDAVAARFRTQRPVTIAVFAAYGSSIRRYYVINTIFGAAVALLDGLLLFALGVPGALVWVVLAFVTNYIPSIGFVLGLIPPVLLALVSGGWGTAVLVLLAYCVINVTVQTFLQPRFVSHAVRLNLTLTFFSVVFWTAVLGPIGAVLAVPMTLLIRTMLLETDDRAAFARWVTGDRTAG